MFEDDIRGALKNCPLQEIKDTIKNYSLILKDEKYIYTYEHTISGFLLPKNFEKFRDLERAKKNFLTRGADGRFDEDYNIPKYKPDKREEKTKGEIIIEREKISKLAGKAARELRKK